MEFKWSESAPEERPKAPSPIIEEHEANTDAGGVTAHHRGYISSDAHVAANELHFQQSNARAIHGAISSASRHAQGKRDHRGM